MNIAVNPKRNWWRLGLLALILILTFLIRVPFLAEPFECDQANYGYIAWNWEQGRIPYQDLFDNKPPIFYLFLRFILKIFGYSVQGLHLAYAILAVFSNFVFYRLSRMIFREGIALLSAFLYGLFSGGALISGSFVNSENLMVFFVIFAFWLFWKAYQEEKIFLFFISGIFMGLAMMSKQLAFFETMAMSVFLYWAGLRYAKPSLNLKRILLIWFGAGLVIILCFIYFTIKGAGKVFFDTVFVFNLFFARIVGIRQGLVNLWESLFWTPQENFLLWALAGLGLSIAGFKRDDKSMLMMLWATAAFLGVMSALRFYHHYFIQIIPVLVLLAVFFLNEVFWNKTVLLSPAFLMERLGLRNALVPKELTTPPVALVPQGLIRKKYLGFGLLALTLVFFMRIQWRYYFQYSPLDSLINRRGKLARPQLYKATPQISKLIKDNTKPDDYIYVWGLWPEIYFYSQRQASCRYYFFPTRGIFIGESSDLFQKKVLEDTVRNKPKYFIIDYNFSDLLSAPLEEYLRNNYYLDREIVGCQVLQRRDY